MFPAHDHGGTERLGDPSERTGRLPYLGFLVGVGKNGVASTSGSEGRFVATGVPVDDVVALRGAARKERGGADAGSGALALGKSYGSSSLGFSRATRARANDSRR